MSTIEVGGVHVAVTDDGDGPPLIALHQATSSGAAFLPRIRAIVGPGPRIVLPDALGHGGTAWPPDVAWSTSALVEETIGVADALGLATFDLLGFSMGAMTALRVAAAAPDRVRTLVALSITPDREPRLAVVRSSLDPDRIEREEPAWASALAAAHDPLLPAGGWRAVLRAVIADIDEGPAMTGAELRAIVAPALVVTGDRDPVVPVAQAAALARRVRDGRLLVLPGVGHDVLAAPTTILAAAVVALHDRTEASIP